MNRAEKARSVERLGQVFSDSGVVVVFHYAGLTVADMSALRAQARERGAVIYVAKNRLARVALEGKPCAALSALLRGQTALAYSDDPVAAPNAVVRFAKENDKLALLGGAMGERILDEAAVKALAALPSLDALRGKIVGLLQAPAGRLARTVSAPSGQIARLLAAFAQRSDAA